MYIHLNLYAAATIKDTCTYTSVLAPRLEGALLCLFGVNKYILIKINKK